MTLVILLLIQYHDFQVMTFGFKSVFYIVKYVHMMETELRHLPSVDRIISDERISFLLQDYPRELLVDLARKRLEHDRLSINAGGRCTPFDEIIDSVIAKAKELTGLSLRYLVNASGVILHTNLGRAPLSKEAIEAMDAISGGYSNLEYDLATGVRGSRYVHIEQTLCQLTGAEAALVVNNNAAGMLLALSTLAKRKEVIVSRGQAVEIGGGFRIPDVMRQSGAKLVEVGTTNCTYTADYEQAITPRTVALLRVHPSNFLIEGFTHTVELEEIIDLGNKYDIPLLDDVGSGCFLDTTAFGFAREPVVQESISAGAALVLFSGDKLVGGPQAGIIVGRKQLINKMKKNALTRALRIDKIRMAGLAATLVHYLKGEAVEKVPIWRMASAPLDVLKRRATAWAHTSHDMATVVHGESMLGGGSLPGSTIATWLVCIEGESRNRRKNTAQILSDRLRRNNPPVIGRIADDKLYLDPRSVLPEDDHVVLKALDDLTA
jgi:L-seryl-tRNA(Ser) seleniumtransferase